MMNHVIFTYMVVCAALVIHNVLALKHDVQTDNYPILVQGTGTLSYIRGGWINTNPPTISTLIIKRANTDYSQVRLYFRTLSLAGPNSESLCVTDAITFAGQQSPVTSTLCGDLTGQHVYLNFAASQDIIVTIVHCQSTTSSWEIELTQFRNTDALFAPPQCLQYHITRTGIVESFNYAAVATATAQIGNLDYLVCVSTQQTYCSIQWIPSGEFSVIADGTFGAIYVFATGAVNCKSDYLEFSPAEYTDLAGNLTIDSRFCGNVFPPAGVKVSNGITTASIFSMRVVTDGTEAPYDINNVGFLFNYSTSVTC